MPKIAKPLVVAQLPVAVNKPPDFLSRVSYYRVAGYFRYWQRNPANGDNTFFPGSTFTTIQQLYEEAYSWRHRPRMQPRQQRGTVIYWLATMWQPAIKYLPTDS